MLFFPSYLFFNHKTKFPRATSLGTKNTDKQLITHQIGIPNIKGNQAHRIVHRKNADQ